MSNARSRRKALKNSIKWGAGLFLSIPISLLAVIIPYSSQRAFGRALGIIVFHLLSRERNRAIKNITAALPSLRRGSVSLRAEDSPYEIAREVFANLGISCIELIKLYYGNGERIIDSVSIEGIENYRKAQSLSKGVILISGHCGNWELMGMAVCRHLAKLSVVAKRQSNSLFNGIIEKLRNRYGSSVIYNRGAAKAIFLTLPEGEIVEFLDRPAWMTTAPPAIAEKTGSPIVPFFIHRENGGHRVIISEPIYPEQYSSATEITRKLNSEIEEYIRNHPDEWLWMYNRWKGVHQHQL